MAIMKQYAGDKVITRQELAALPLPAQRGRFHRIMSFNDYVELIENRLHWAGYFIIDEEHVIGHGGMRHFFTMILGATGDDDREPLGGDGWTFVLGGKGAYDQATNRALAGGHHVGICSNLMFGGDCFTKGTKQTTNAWDRVTDMIRDSVALIDQEIEARNRRIELLRDRVIPLPRGDEMLVQMFRSNGMSASQLGRALHEWVRPSFEQHAEWGNSLWLLEQAVTQALKPTGASGSNLFRIFDRNQVAKTVIDGELDLAA